VQDALCETAVYLPAGHDSQDALPLGLYLPAAQSVQDTLPLGLYFPAAHDSQDVLPKRLYFPAAQDSQGLQMQSLSSQDTVESELVLKSTEDPSLFFQQPRG